MWLRVWRLYTDARAAWELICWLSTAIASISMFAWLSEWYQSLPIVPQIGFGIAAVLAVFPLLVRIPRLIVSVSATKPERVKGPVRISVPEHHIKLWKRQGRYSVESDVNLRIENSGTNEPLMRDLTLALVRRRWWGRLERFPLGEREGPTAVQGTEFVPLKEIRLQRESETDLWVVVRYEVPSTANPKSITDRYFARVFVSVMSAPTQEFDLPISWDEFLANA